jgi:cell division septal protein FtsQ
MSTVAAATRRLRRRRLSHARPRLRLSRQRLRLAVALAAFSILVLGGGWLLLRDSSVVAIDQVAVTGASGADAGAIQASLESTARKMTTLDVSTARLWAAVSRFPEVKGVRVSTHFPHGIVIHVIELLPVAAVKLSGREIAVTGDGALLPKLAVTGALPLMALAEPPIGGRLHQPWALRAARLLAAAPPQLLPRLAEVTTVVGHGLVVQIRSGPSIYFGDASRPRDKWIAALAVLADPKSAGALYIDVTDPERPAAGAGEQAAQAAGATISATTAASGAAGATGGTASAAGGGAPSTSGATSPSPPTTGGAGSSAGTTGG